MSLLLGDIFMSFGFIKVEAILPNLGDIIPFKFGVIKSEIGFFTAINSCDGKKAGISFFKISFLENKSSMIFLYSNLFKITILFVGVFKVR